MKTELVVYFLSVTKQLMKETRDRLRMGTEKAGTDKKAGTNQYTGIGTR